MLHHAPVIYYHIYAKSTHTFSGKCEIEVLMAFATAILLKLAFAMPNLASDLWSVYQACYRKPNCLLCYKPYMNLSTVDKIEKVSN